MGTITHKKVSLIEDDPAAVSAGEVVPSDWNDNHDISLTSADIADSLNKRYVTDAQLVVIGNTSGTNTGDQTNITGNAGTVTTINGLVSAGTNVTITGSGDSGSPYVINSSGGSGVSDGDKGDITVSGSGAVWTVDTLDITKISGLNPAPSNGSIIFTNGSSFASDNSNLYFDSTNHIMSVKTNGDFNGSDAVNIYGEYDAYQPNSAMGSVGTVAVPGVSASTSRGTGASPVINNTGDLIGGYTFWAYSGATPAYKAHSGMYSSVTGATSNNLGGTLSFYTKADNGALTSRLTIDHAGVITNPTFTVAGVVTNNASGVLASSASLAATLGGTGQTSYAVGDILYASTTTAVSKLADVATGNVVISGGVGVAPSYGKVGLTTHVSGILPVANGGTNNAFFTVSGPATSAKTYTFPNATCTVLTSNAVVTVAQGGIGVGTLTGIAKGNGTSAFTAATAETDYVTPTGTGTLTNKRINQRTSTTASSATPTPNGDTDDIYTITALAAAAAFGAPTGTPVNGQKLTIRIKDNGTARSLTWNAIYRAGTDVALPTTTVISKTMYVGFIYNSTDSKWDLVSSIGNI